MATVAVLIDNLHDPAPIIAAHEPFLPEGCDIWHIKNEPIRSIADYNSLLTSRRFWRNMPEKVIIIQHDSGLLRTIDEDLFNYGFIGAPIKHIHGCMNGGLSIRNRDVMLSIIDKHPYQGMGAHGNEDIYFCNRLIWIGTNIPDKETAARFSVETEFSLGSCGWHAIDKYLTPEQCNQIKNQYL